MSARIGRVVVLALAVAAVLVGGLWTAQSLGYVESSMDDPELYAIVGPLVAGLGVALLVVALRRRS